MSVYRFPYRRPPPRRALFDVNATILVELLEGVTVRASFTVTPGAAVAESSYTLTTPERDAITNWGNLFLRMTKQNGQVSVTQAFLQAPLAGGVTLVLQDVIIGGGGVIPFPR